MSHNSRLGHLESGLEITRNTLERIQASVNELDGKLGSLREELIQIFQVKIRESEEKLRAASNRN